MGYLAPWVWSHFFTGPPSSNPTSPTQLIKYEGSLIKDFAAPLCFLSFFHLKQISGGRGRHKKLGIYYKMLARMLGDECPCMTRGFLCCCVPASFPLSSWNWTKEKKEKIKTDSKDPGSSCKTIFSILSGDKLRFCLSKKMFFWKINGDSYVWSWKK